MNPMAEEYDYQYAVRLTATDVTNDLYVQKQSSTSAGFNEACINGVKFALYPKDQTTWLSGLPGHDVKLNDCLLYTSSRKVREEGQSGQSIRTAGPDDDA